MEKASAQLIYCNVELREESEELNVSDSELNNRNLINQTEAGMKISFK